MKGRGRVPGACHAEPRSLSHSTSLVSSEINAVSSPAVCSAEKMGSTQATRPRIASSSSVSDLWDETVSSCDQASIENSLHGELPRNSVVTANRSGFFFFGSMSSSNWFTSPCCLFPSAISPHGFLGQGSVVRRMVKAVRHSTYWTF